jgi:hypothetical protein
MSHNLGLTASILDLRLERKGKKVLDVGDISTAVMTNYISYLITLIGHPATIIGYNR